MLGKGNDAGEGPAGSEARQAFAMLEGVQGQAAKEILKEVDVVVCSCIGAGNDAFVRAIGGDQERYDRRTAPSIESHTLIRIYLYGVKSCITANYRRDAAATSHGVCASFHQLDIAAESIQVALLS